MNTKLNITRLTRIAAASLTASILVACATPGLTLNYSPSSIRHASGNIEVGEFKYSVTNPRTGNPVPQNQIRNTAMGDIIIDREVSRFVREAVFAELRGVGINVRGTNRILTANVEEFLVDDLGYSIDWTFRVRYNIAEKATGNLVFTSTKTVQRKTAKFGNPLGALSETIKLSVEQLLDDEDFLRVIAKVGT